MCGRHPWVRRLGLVFVLATCVAACSSKQAAPPAPSTSGTTANALCESLRASGVDAIVGANAKPVSPGPAGDPVPVAQCVLGSGATSVSFAYFNETGTYSDLTRLLPHAQTESGLGTSGYCGGNASATAANHACVFIRNGKTYVVGARYPAKVNSAERQAAVVALARSLDAHLEAA